MSKTSLPRLGLFLVPWLVLATIVPAPVSAAPILLEPFDYPNGPLVGSGGWMAHNSPGSKPVLVTDGTIRLEQSFGLGEDVARAFPSQSSTARTYAYFELVVPPGASGSAFEYFAHFRSTPDTLAYRARVYVGSFTATGYRLGLTATSAGVSHPIEVWPVELSYTRAYRVVQSFDASNGVAELWVNPADENSPRITSASAAAAGAALGSYGFRQSSLNDSYQVIRDLAVGSTFAEVLPPASVPGLSGWGMAALAGALGAAGARLAARRASGTIKP